VDGSISANPSIQHGMLVCFVGENDCINTACRSGQRQLFLNGLSSTTFKQWRIAYQVCPTTISADLRRQALIHLLQPSAAGYAQSQPPQRACKRRSGMRVDVSNVLIRLSTSYSGSRSPQSAEDTRYTSVSDQILDKTFAYLLSRRFARQRRPQLRC
jgi:hypothetical protein